MLLLLAVLGYALAGLLLLVLLALLACLWAPFSFRLNAAFSAEVCDEAEGAYDESGEAYDAYLLALLTSAAGTGEALQHPGRDAVGDTAPVWAHLEFRARWLGGLLTADQHGVRFLSWRLGKRMRTGPTTGGARESVEGRPADRKTTSPAGRRVRKVRRARGRARRLRRLALPTIRRLWPRVKRALSQSWARLHLTASLRLTLGLDDPAAAAIVSGMVGGMRASPPFLSLVGRRGLDIRVVPVFDREMVAGDVELSGRSSAKALLGPWLRLALSRDVRKLWWPRRNRAARSKGG